MSVPAPISQGELPYITARPLFFATGFDAGCGHPLPDGSLPVGGKGLGGAMHLILPAEWNAYLSLCAAERAAVPEFAAAA